MYDPVLALGETPVNNIYGNYAMKYYESGYNVIPLRPNTKIPALTNWSNWCENRQESFQVENWAYSEANSNIGIPLGIASNLIALDFDNDIDNLHESIVSLIQGSPVKKKGNKGFTAFYRYNGEMPKKWYKDGKAVVELLSTGNQTVVPPSIHPDTKQPYIWITPDTLFDIQANDLPFLPVNFIEQINYLFGYAERLPAESKFSGELPELREVEKAMSFVASDEYATWITIGMALHHSYGEVGFNAWDNWSRKAPNYDNKIMGGKWASFGKAANPVALGTIFHYAVGCGYIMPVPEPLFDGIPTIIFKAAPVEKTAIDVSEKTDLIFPQKLLDNAPGLPGQIAAWINSTAIKRQPILALAAALCASGTIFAHKIRSKSDLRTNFMILGLAESGCGKEHARRCVDSLFTTVKLDQLLLGDFASDTSIISALRNKGGVGFAMLDEIGRELKALNSNRAGGHEARILTTLMKIFSQANSVYRGKEYANHQGDMNRQDLIQPCLNIYGTTVPSRFYDALTSDDAIDGFLARWLVFETKDIAPIKQENGDLKAIPQHILDSIEFIKGLSKYAQPKFSMSALKEPEPEPNIIPFTEGAADILQKLDKACEESRIKEIKKGSKLAAIWARTCEHAIKIALVSHPFHEGIIDEKTMQWAAEMALYLSNASVIAITNHVADNEYEKNLNRVYNIIKRFNDRNNEPMRHWKLADAVRNLKQRECTEILQHLAQSGRIEVQDIQANGKNSYAYKAL